MLVWDLAVGVAFMHRKDLKTQFENITIWKKGTQRAPHKPLLLLYALARCVNNGTRLIPYQEIDQKLKQLLRDFGPSRKSYHPEYPFWRLQNDGIWALTNTAKVTPRKSNSDAKKSELLKHNVCGGFSPEVFNRLSRDHRLAAAIAESILNEHFPASIHEDILQSVGLDFDYAMFRRKIRNPEFRQRILRAYEYRCAICGFDIRLDTTPIALESAHIKWYKAGGPDQENNGLALCTLHHKLFDRGAFTLSSDLLVQVSDRANGTTGLNEWLLAFNGKPIRPPQKPAYYPLPNYIAWHVEEVFQGDARYY